VSRFNRRNPRQILNQLVEPGSGVIFLFEHDLFGKPVSTFPDHALKRTESRHVFGRIVVGF
jgi:hypothetical protein